MELLIRDVFCSSWMLATMEDGVWDGPQPVAIKTSGDKVVTSKRCVTVSPFTISLLFQNLFDFHNPLVTPAEIKLFFFGGGIRMNRFVRQSVLI